MGTPHQGGSGVHLGELMLKVASIFVMADDKILKHLERDSESQVDMACMALYMLGAYMRLSLRSP